MTSKARKVFDFLALFFYHFGKIQFRTSLANQCPHLYQRYLFHCEREDPVAWWDIKSSLVFMNILLDRVTDFIIKDHEPISIE
jgi:hypothetical protein